MQVSKVQSQPAFGAIYKVPLVNKANILKYEETVAPLYRSMKKKAITGVDAGPIGFYVFTENDAIQFDKYRRDIKDSRQAFFNICNEVTQTLSNVVKLYTNKEFIYTRNYINARDVELLDSFDGLTAKLFEK